MKARAWLLLGNDPVRRKEALRRIRSEVFQRPAEGLSDTESFSFPEHCVAEIMDYAKTLPFYSKQRLLLIHEIQRIHRQDEDRFLQGLRAQTGAAWVLMTSETTLSRKAFLSRLGRLAQVIDCREPARKEDAANWVLEKSTEEEYEIRPEVLELLIDQTGMDLGSLSHRLESLFLFAYPEKTIRLEHLDALAGFAGKTSAFRILKALGEGRRALALRILKGLLQTGARPLEILGAMIWQFERWIRIRNLLAGGFSPSAIAERLGIRSAFLGHEINEARRLLASRVLRFQEAFTRCDVAIKRGLLPADLALERCLLGLSEMEEA